LPLVENPKNPKIGPPLLNIRKNSEVKIGIGTGIVSN
jgi:hypothetical protein